MTDVIDRLAGITPGSALDALRRQKPVTRDNAQASFDALFAPANLSDMSGPERRAVALFVAALHEDAAATGYYRHMLAAEPELVRSVLAASGEGRGAGPYGRYPDGPLAAEDLDGPTLAISEPVRAALGARLAAALEHAHMLVFHLRDADPAAMRSLEEAGWSATGIVTLSQLVSFLSFQIRAAHGLRALAASMS